MVMRRNRTNSYYHFKIKIMTQFLAIAGTGWLFLIAAWIAPSRFENEESKFLAAALLAAIAAGVFIAGMVTVLVA
jgi:hypothetical protein